MENSPKSEDYPDDSRIVLYESFSSDIDYLNGVGYKTYHTTHQVWKVFKNTERFSTVFDSFPENAKIENFYARTISPDGKVTVLHSSDFLIEEVTRESSDHEDTRKMMKFIFPALQENAILEYKYTTVLDGPSMLSRWWIQSYYPKLETHLHVRIPKWIVQDKRSIWGWKYKVYNYDNVVMDKQKEKYNDAGDIIFHWTAKNVPPVERETYSGEPTRTLGYMKLSIHTQKSWRIQSYKYYEWYIGEKLKPSKILKKKAIELTKDAKTEEEKIKAIYYFVRQFSYDSYHTRYGHGIISNKPELILERRYGDCKDQSILIVALLRELEIDAYPALIWSGNDSNIDISFPSDYFNHQIVYVKTEKGEDLWLDPTFSTLPYGVVSSSGSDRFSLVLAEENKMSKPLKRTPKVTPEMTGKEEYKLLIDITSDKKTKTTIAIKSFGETAGHRMWAFRELKDVKEIKQYYRHEIKYEYADTKEMIAEYKYDDPEEKKDYYEMSFIANLELLNKKKNLYYLDYFPLAQEYADGAGFIENLNREKKERTHDIRWPSLFRKEIDITIKYPENLKIHALPQNKVITLADKNLEFSFDIRKVSQGILRLRIIFSRNEKLLDKKEYDALKQFYLNIAKTITRRIVFEDATTQVEPTNEESTETAPTEGGE